MKNQIVLLVIVSIISMLGGGILVYEYKPRTVTKTETVAQTVTQDHVVTVIKTVKEPTGATVTTETITDNTVHTEHSDETQIKAPQWHVGLGASTGLDLVPSYSIQVEKRLVGPLFIGARAETRGALGLVISVEF